MKLLPIFMVLASVALAHPPKTPPQKRNHEVPSAPRKKAATDATLTKQTVPRRLFGAGDQPVVWTGLNQQAPHEPSRNLAEWERYEAPLQEDLAQEDLPLPDLEVMERAHQALAIEFGGVREADVLLAVNRAWAAAVALLMARPMNPCGAFAQTWRAL